MECPKCNIPLESGKYILTDDGFMEVTRFYTCKMCNEEYYNLDELERSKNGRHTKD